MKGPSSHLDLPTADDSVIRIQDDLNLIKNYLTPAFLKKTLFFPALKIFYNPLDFPLSLRRILSRSQLPQWIHGYDKTASFLTGQI
ncbi:MAG: hypothetical protein PWP56_1377 [Acetobacterium sp.]|jgi:hypothetical protein|uniref:hypothetical protein n=1 Tax=Acetobacterium sp. K1/6 TaxID=3055467 RepID=UPI0029E0B6DA|nr:hypothetical protein [Acetobacterium sp. K1/6]MDK2941864.1 hypothetical protein [Acetobacterium sp.]MDZ5723579.1 hypothetical protein [Acetobacterium sp. K1/6]